jgi:hypothetical protein
MRSYLAANKKKCELKVPDFDINLPSPIHCFAAMLINLRKKPDLTFTRIDHTGMTGRNIWQQYSQCSNNT